MGCEKEACARGRGRYGCGMKPSLGNNEAEGVERKIS